MKPATKGNRSSSGTSRPPQRRGGAFYGLTFLLALVLGAFPIALFVIREGEFPDLPWIDAGAAIAAAFLFWACALMGLTRAVRVFGSMATAVIAGVMLAPVLANLVFETFGTHVSMDKIAQAVFEVVFGITGLIAFGVLGLFLKPSSTLVKKMRAARALNSLLGVAFGLLVVCGLCLIYAHVLPEMQYPRWWAAACGFSP